MGNVVSLQPETDLTLAFRTYRECARLVWNTFLRLCPDGEHGFNFVDAELVDAMLISQVERYEDAREIGGYEYYDRLQVLPQGVAPLDVLCGHLVDGSFDWRREAWSPDRASLRYRSLFDWVTLDGEWRDFRYVEAIVVSSGEPPFERGRRVLLESDTIRIIDTSLLLTSR
jgi:hypothetical protein